MDPLTWYEVGKQLSVQIIQTARSVHHWMGHQCQLVEYRSAVTNELRRQHLDVQQQFPVDVWQSGELVDLYFVDLFVECQVIVMIKATRHHINSEDRQNMVECLQACNVPMGVLLNFGQRGLEYERIFPGGNPY